MTGAGRQTSFFINYLLFLGGCHDHKNFLCSLLSVLVLSYIQFRQITLAAEIAHDTAIEIRLVIVITAGNTLKGKKSRFIRAYRGHIFSLFLFYKKKN